MNCEFYGAMPTLCFLSDFFEGASSGTSQRLHHKKLDSNEKEKIKYDYSSIFSFCIIISCVAVIIKQETPKQKMGKISKGIT